MQTTRLIWRQKFIIYRSTIVFKILCYLLFRFGNVKPALTIENKRMRTSSAPRSSCCRGPHARNLTGLRGTSSYTRDIACVAYLSPCFQAMLHDVRGWESSLQIYARVFFPAQNILEVPRQDEKNQNFPQPVVSGNSYNKTGKKWRYIVSGRSVSSRRLEFERNCNPSEMKSMFLAKNRWNFICRFSCILYRR